MNIEDYSEQAWSTADYPDNGIGINIGESVFKINLMYPLSKYAGEMGEFNEKIGKLIRDKNGILSGKDQEELLKELGDGLWYINALAIELGSSLSEVAQMNLDKLASRKNRGVIHGSGDNR